MTTYEIIRFLVMPFLPVLYRKTHHDLSKLIAKTGKRNFKLLDVGGRKSPYTISLPAKVTIIDIPRETEIQNQLFLGVTSEIIDKVKHRRSNVVNIILEDMTKCTIPSKSFDGIVSVEVIEHIYDVDKFVEQIYRVLKPGGWVYFTTPNGEYIRNEPPYYNPDHFRHYTRLELQKLLNSFFSNVQITYGVKTGKYRSLGLKSIPTNNPVMALRIVFANMRNWQESKGLSESSHRTAHLFAIAYKPDE